MPIDLNETAVVVFGFLDLVQERLRKFRTFLSSKYRGKIEDVFVFRGIDRDGGFREDKFDLHVELELDIDHVVWWNFHLEYDMHHWTISGRIAWSRGPTFYELPPHRNRSFVDLVDSGVAIGALDELLGQLDTVDKAIGEQTSL